MGNQYTEAQFITNPVLGNIVQPNKGSQSETQAVFENAFYTSITYRFGQNIEKYPDVVLVLKKSPACIGPVRTMSQCKAPEQSIQPVKPTTKYFTIFISRFTSSQLTYGVAIVKQKLR